jgi:energy-coupling factor transporter ATP-binding protein EcfA2
LADDSGYCRFSDLDLAEGGVAMSAMIELNELSFRHAMTKKWALQDISVQIPAGQIVGIIGRNGAGKSTLCSICAGLMFHVYQGRMSGSVTVNGIDVVSEQVSDVVPHASIVSSNPQSQISGIAFTVYAEVAFGLENLGLPVEQIHERVTWALNALELWDLRDRSPYELSGGQQQRMIIAAIMALRSKVLILDEPTSQLDLVANQLLANVLRELADQGTTILVAEQNLDWLVSACDRVLVLNEGKLVADGLPEQILRDPLLQELGIGWPYVTQIGERLRQQNLWPHADLPTCYQQLEQGLERYKPNQIAQALAKPPTARVAEPMIEISQVAFAYGEVQALRNINCTINTGERIALLGPNGAGKSTFLRMLNGLLKPQSGNVVVGGFNTRKTSTSQLSRQVGIVFQDVRNQLFAKTVRQELSFGLRNLSFRGAPLEARIDAALDALQLREYANEHPYDLPQSLQRLTAIAAVLAMDPSLLILDEPTAGLDAHAIGLLDTMLRERVVRGNSVLVVSHNLEFCYNSLDRVLLMNEGQIIVDTQFSSFNSSELQLLDQTIGLPIALRLQQR